MISYLIACFASSLCVLTLYTLFSDGQSIFGKFPYYIEKTPLRYFRKPLYECLVCMSSIWGGSFFFVFSTLFYLDIGVIKTLLAILIIAGFNIVFAFLVSILQLFQK